MSRPNKLQIMERSKKSILSFLTKQRKSFFTYDDLNEIFSTKKDQWGLAKSTKFIEFINFLISINQLERVEFEFSHKSFVKYVYKKVSTLELASTLFKDSYLSHYSAATFHGLTNDNLKLIFINKEQTSKHRAATDANDLEQKNIDLAFSRKMRLSQNYTYVHDYKITLLNGKYTDCLGVVTYANDVKVTDIERTLIDIVVRPDYAGGCEEIVKIYRNAKRKVSTQKLFDYLRKINYAYPYHQSIGFFLDKAGFEKKDTDPFCELPISVNFYAAYAIDSPLFCEKWRVFYPKDID